MIQNNNSTNVSQSQHITRWGDARELTPEERLSSIDLENLDFEGAVDRILAIEAIRQEIGEEHLDEYREALLEDASLGSKKFLDLVNWYNSKYPDTPILIPSDYVGDVQEVAEPDWVIPGIAVRNNTTLLYGDAGVGKTTFYLHLVDALANGQEFVGIQCSKCKALVICQDEDHSLLKNHWATMGKTALLPVAKKNIIWDKGKGDFNEDFDTTLRVYKPDVVFIDSYTSLAIPDITRPESGSVFDAMNRIARERKCAIILIHHTNLSGEPMGSSLHRAKVSSLVSIRITDDSHIVVEQEKVRGSHFDPIVIRFNRENLSMEKEEGSLREQIWRLLDQNETADDIIQRFPNRNRATIQRYIREHTHVRTDTS
jgi:archaellum biogenesis ATPase FlaH